MLASLQSQLAVAQQLTGYGRMRASAEATYNGLLAEGKSHLEAQQIASAQLAVNQANVTSGVEQQITSLEDQTRLMKAGEGSQRARVASEIAYNRALEDGADEQSAAALAAATYTNEMQKAAQATGNVAKSWGQIVREIQRASAAAMDQAAALDAQERDSADAADYSAYLQRDASWRDGSQSIFDEVQNSGQQYESTDDPFSVVRQFVNRITSGGQTSGFGGGGGAGDFPINDVLRSLNELQQYRNQQRQSYTSAQAQYLSGGSTEDQISGMEMQIRNLTENIGSNPENVWQILSLQRSIDELRNSTDDLNSTYSASLNPLYNGRDALKVGYYKAARGLDVVATGPTSGDQVPFHAMVNGGERITITPAGQTANDNSSTSTTTVTNNIVINGSRSTNRRSARQLAQGYGQLMASLS